MVFALTDMLFDGRFAGWDYSIFFELYFAIHPKKKGTLSRNLSKKQNTKNYTVKVSSVFFLWSFETRRIKKVSRNFDIKRRKGSGLKVHEL